MKNYQPEEPVKFYGEQREYALSNTSDSENNNSRSPASNNRGSLDFDAGSIYGVNKNQIRN